MAEFRKWQAEKRAEEKARIKKEKHEAKKAKLMADINRHQSLAEKSYARYEAQTRMLMKAERKLEALMEKGEEV
jgi:hypothetical protein